MALTQVSDPDLLRAWRTGPRWFHVVVAVIDDLRVERRRCDVASLLSDLVELTTPGQPHVTLWAAGFDTQPVVPVQADVTLTVAGPATFTSALYLTVTSPDLKRLRAELAAGNPPEDRAGAYTPHVTVGLYQRRFPIAAVEQRLTALHDLPPLTVTARIEHRAVDTRTDRLHAAPA